MEDDFKFTVSKEEFEKLITQFFESNINYDVCMLAYNSFHEVFKNEDIPGISYLKKVLEVQTASAYLVNGHYYDKLINLYTNTNRLLEQTGIHWVYANIKLGKFFSQKIIGIILFHE